MFEIIDLGRLRGNAPALTRLFVISLFLLVSDGLAWALKAPPSVVVGSTFGAALSLFVNWIVPFLERAESKKLPLRLLAAAEEDASLAGYYRENQSIQLSTAFDTDRGETTVILVFTAKIVVVLDQARILHPDIVAPEGTELIESTYFVGNAAVPKETFALAKQATTDNLRVVYKITDPSKKMISDIHFWPSPVIGYTIRHEMSDEYELSVSKLISGKESQTLPQRKIGKGKVIEYYGNGAFTSQRLKWPLSRTAQVVTQQQKLSRG